MTNEKRAKIPARKYHHTIVCAVGRPAQWPPLDKWEFPEIQFDFGRLFLEADSEGCFGFWYMAEHEIEHGTYIAKRSAKHKTDPFDFDKPVVSGLFEAKNDEIVSIYLDRKHIWGGTREFADLDQANFDPAQFDFANENHRAIDTRKSSLAGLRSNKFRDHPGVAYDFEALQSECHQIRDLLEAILDKGAHYHIPGLLARARAVLYEKSGLALLQLCAAHLEFDLVFPVHPVTLMTGQFGEDAFLLSSPIASWQGILQEGGDIEIDLDVWLAQTGLISKGKKYTNREVIKELGNGLGAHRLPSSNDVTKAMLSRPKMPGPKALDLVGATAVNVGSLILFVATKVLREYTERKDEGRALKGR